MSSSVQFALTVTPLAFYFWVLAILQGGRHPRVVAGAFDVLLLAFGVGGLLLFGPFGQVLARMLFGRPRVVDWLTLIMGMGVVTTVLARRSLRRLVVYHIDPEALDRALREALDAESGQFERALNGFEDRQRGQGITVRTTPMLQAAVVEAAGLDAESLIRRLGPRLQKRLLHEPARPSPLVWVWFALSGLTMLVPTVVFFLTQPRARSALRGLLERLQGG